MLKFATLTSAAVLLAACANTPDATYNFYPARSSTAVTVTQTISCNGDSSDIVIAYPSTPTQLVTSYAADYSKAPSTLRVRDLDGGLSDSDVTIGLSDDGRLKTINGTSTGQGEAIVKSVISLAAAVGGAGGNSHPVFEAKAKTHKITACGYVTKWAGKGKSITLTYSKIIRLEDSPNGDFIGLDDTVSDPNLLAGLRAAGANMPHIGIKIGAETAMAPVVVPTMPGGSSENDVRLKLQSTASTQVDILAGTVRIATGTFTIPGRGTYEVPIPRAAAFGGTKFSLTVNDPGVITGIEYNKTNGTSQALDTATAASGLLQAQKPASPPSQ
ncbi:MAG TPA: hypothetical protein VMH86_16040 [Rhizomicrobium sp.]|nr:hypothetical protein [Rhizomicrobium sp.]